MNMKTNKMPFYIGAVVLSLCVICIVAAAAINTNDPTKRAEQYAKEYQGSVQAYTEIFNSTDCAFLQGQFETAYQSSEASDPGTIYSIRATGYMTATNERMKEIGCYK